MSIRRIKHQSTHFTKRRRARMVLISGLVLISIISWVYSLVRFMSLPALNINIVEITGIDPGRMSTLQAAVANSLRGNILGLFPRSNVLLYSGRDISDELKSIEPSVSSVNVTNVGGTTLKVVIKEKTPAALACTQYPDFTDSIALNEKDDECYYVDNDALIFKRAPSLTGNAYHRYYVPTLLNESSTSTTSAVIGAFATSTSEFHKLQAIYARVVESGIIVNAILIKENGEYEMYVDNPKAKSNDSGSGDGVTVVYFNNARAFDEQMANLASFWSTMISGSAHQGKTATFDYIDVRYGANVFYK